MFAIDTDHPIAFESVDHLHPRGTKNDNSTNLEFNRRLFELFDAPPAVLDLGCSGGGFVHSLLEMGATAMGLEGSDYSKRTGRAEWPRIPDNLFTVDLGRPFRIRDCVDCGRPAVFDVVTAWEFLEHLELGELRSLLAVLEYYTADRALFIGSIATVQDRHGGHDYHATVKPPVWWLAFFEARGWNLREDLMLHFAPHWVRGPNTDGASSYPFVLEKA